QLREPLLDGSGRLDRVGTRRQLNGTGDGPFARSGVIRSCNPGC
ncbi:hypothetical protein PSYPI_46956, partial [Pseudomonas syringae pv. pisi str. 1704B]